MKNSRKWLFILSICSFFVATTLSIFHEWQIGFWSTTMPTSIYITMCVAYVFCIICLFLGLYINLIYKEGKGQ